MFLEKIRIKEYKNDHDHDDTQDSGSATIYL